MPVTVLVRSSPASNQDTVTLTGPVPAGSPKWTGVTPCDAYPPPLSITRAETQPSGSLRSVTVAPARVKRPSALSAVTDREREARSGARSLR